eukprot:752936-Hanusia_phi.AAC.2
MGDEDYRQAAWQWLRELQEFHPPEGTCHERRKERTDVLQAAAAAAAAGAEAAAAAAGRLTMEGSGKSFIFASAPLWMSFSTIS